MRLLIAVFAIVGSIGAACAAPVDKLVEPSLHVAPGGVTSPRVALTLDACGGATDTRILDALVENNIPATIFVTGKWLKRNRVAFDVLRAHPDLFEIGNHGDRHLPAVDHPVKIFGIAAAGSPEAVRTEVETGASDIVALGGDRPRWYRGSTAQYSVSAIALIRTLGFEVAGYSINGDGGSLLGEKTTESRISQAHDGDVIIAHINQPTHAAGGGVVKGVLDLKARGFTFVRLSDEHDTGSDQTTN